MSFYSDASLVMIPSGYKTSKVYSAVPTDGTGDLTFTRSNDTATRVNSAGLIEKVRTNLLRYSNDFSNAAWSKIGGTTLTAGQADYLGGTNAWKWEATGVGTIQLAQSPAGSTIRTASIYAKAGSISTINLWVGSAVIFNLSTGTVTSGNGVITSVGNGWYRCSAFGTGISHNPYFASASAGDYVLISFAQMDEGDIATQYIPTTTAAVSVGPVSNVPRLDYLNTTCPRLLLEPQRTNLATYSEQFNNVAWTKQDVNVTANAAIAPDGTQSADNIVPTAVSGTHQIFSGALVSSSQCAMSVYAKANGYTTFHMLDRASGSNGASFNLANGTVTNAGSGVGTITSVGNGWYRCTAVATTTGVRFYIPTPASNFTGDGTSGVLLWGAQVEAGAYATSYIPTLGAAVTRGADACSKTGISSLIGQTEGTLFLDINVPSITSAGTYASHTLNDGTSSNQIEFTYYPTGRIQAVGIVGGSVNVNINLTSYGLTAGNHKIAFAYKLNDYVLYVDGAQAGADTSASVPATSVFNLYAGSGSTQVYNQALLFKTRLTNAQLAELTTI